MANEIAGQRLILKAATAGDLMTTNPISVEASHSVRSATAFLVDKGYTAAPVIDEAGKPLGVLSQTDLLIHQREVLTRPLTANFYEREELESDPTPMITAGIETADLDETYVRDVMTPVVLSVSPTTPAAKVIEQLLAQRVHRLFVVDDAGILVGVISTVDILRNLKPESNACASPEHRTTKGVK